MTELLGDLLLIAWVIPAVGAAVEYLFIRGDDGRRLGFRQTAMGRYLEAHMVALAGIGVLGLVRIAVGDSPVWVGLRVVTFGAVIGIAWWWWIGFVRPARKASERDGGTPHERLHQP